MTKYNKTLLIEALERQRNKDYTVNEVVEMLETTDFKTLKKIAEMVYGNISDNGVFVVGELKDVDTYEQIFNTFKNKANGGYDLKDIILGIVKKDSVVKATDKYITFESAMGTQCLQSVKDLDALKVYLNLENIAEYLIEEKMVDKVFYWY